MKTTFRFVLLFLVAGISAAAAADAARTIIVLDASGSMRERIKGETKMDIAKRAVRELVESLPDAGQLGLVVYSHRKPNDCDDIELLIPPGKLAKATFVAAVEAVKPNGRTPLSAAVQFAAAALDFKNQPANVILISDGLETCGQDPCATVARLVAAAKKLTVHAVAFDLSAKEGKSFECLAAASGGRFLQANDASSLKDALYVVIAETVATAAPTPPAPEVLTAATLEVPPSVIAGAVFPVAWTGPDNPGDTLTIVAKGTPDTNYENFAYTRQGSPLQLTSLIDPGDAEVRYLTSRSRQVLARADIKIIAAQVTLDAIAEATAGAELAVSWTGPNNPGDYITIVPKPTEDGGYAKYANTREGSPLRIAAPIETGEAEIRYLSGQSRRVLARRPLKVNAAAVTLDAAAEAVAGSRVAVAWTGPDNAGDYVTIVPKATPDESYAQYAYTREGATLHLAAPIEAGDGEIRYVSGPGGKVLARRALKLVAVEVTLTAPDEAIAGAEVAVAWTGPDNSGDYITIVPKSTRDDASADYKNTNQGATLQILAPIEPGDGEIRYISGQGRKVLARRPIKFTAAVITLQPPAKAAAASTAVIAWTGPDNSGDFITIVPKGAPDSTSMHYAYARAGSPAKIATPPAAGSAEVRYVSGQQHRVLARADIEITAPESKP